LLQDFGGIFQVYLTVWPLQNEIKDIFSPKREDRLSDPFLDLVQNPYLVRCSHLFRRWTLCKVPAEVPEVRRVFRVHYLVLSTSDCLEIWLMPSRTIRSGQYCNSTMGGLTQPTLPIPPLLAHCLVFWSWQVEVKH